MGAAQDGNKVISEGLNGANSRIPAVAIQRKELVVNVDASCELLEGVVYFIIEVWGPWLEATSSQGSNGSFIVRENLWAEFERR